MALLPLEFLLKPLPMAIELAGAFGGGALLPGAECQVASSRYRIIRSPSGDAPRPPALPNPVVLLPV